MSLNIVFMGTPDFAVPCLQALIDSPHNVVAVFTQPDRPQGRGYKLTPPAIKKLALEHDLPIFQPESLKKSNSVSILNSLNPDLIIVVAYGQMLPKEILDIPPLGCINVHGSLLPKLRGAAPIQWSILNGDKVTGITTMYMGTGMDTGDMILKLETKIGESETGGELFNRLSPMGAELLMETIPQLIDGTAPRTPQDESLATYAPMINKKMGELDFSGTAQQVSHWVRGMNPWPSAYTYLGDKRLTVHTAQTIPDSFNATPGEIVDSKNLIVACGSGGIKLVTVQLEGKKAVSGTDLANGQRLQIGDKFNHST